MPALADWFQQSIQISGSSFAGWGLNQGVINTTARMADAVGCGGLFSDTEALKKCMRGVSIESILAAAVTIV